MRYHEHDPDPAPRERFLSEARCDAIAKRLASFGVGGGETALQIETSGAGTIRFARNEIRSSTDVRNNIVRMARSIRGARGTATGNQIDDLSLLAMVRRAERELTFYKETGGGIFERHWAGAHGSAVGEDPRTDALALPDDPILHPKLFFESTAEFDAASRAAAVNPLVARAKHAGMLAAGFINTTTEGLAMMSTQGMHRYYQFTRAEYTITVRSPDGTGSGWAGVNWNDWDRVDGAKLSAIALDKCLRSRTPTRVEPGRYTAILEPQAVFDLFKYIIERLALLPDGRIVDSRITVTQDPMDPDCGSLPFDTFGNAVRPGPLIEHGARAQGALPPGDAFRMHGGTATTEQMITSTRRGVYVTRFSNIQRIDDQSLLLTGYTRDGTWLIEQGRISKPVKNFQFVESPLFVFNRLEELGVPERVYSVPLFAAVVPAAKVTEFNFTGLTDAV